MKKALILFFLVCSSYVEASQTCKFLLSKFGDGVLKKELEKTEEINPSLVEEFSELNHQSLKELYMILKAEGWRVLPNGMVPWKNKPEISAETLKRLKANFVNIYKTDELSDEKLYIFYANAIHGRYVTVARKIKDDFINSISKQKLSRGLKNFLSLVYESLIDADLTRAETSPESSSNALSQNLEGLIDWQTLIEIAQDYEAQDLVSELDEWIESHRKYEFLTRVEKRLLQQHLGKKEDSRKICCLTNPGCLFCPNNRGFLSH